MTVLQIIEYERTAGEKNLANLMGLTVVYYHEYALCSISTKLIHVKLHAGMAEYEFFQAASRIVSLNYVYMYDSVMPYMHLSAVQILRVKASTISQRIYKSKEVIVFLQL